MNTEKSKNIDAPFSGCGLVGALALGGRGSRSILNRIDFKGMVSSLHHRGPETEGIWQNDTLRLGHRRLSILDLSDRGNQPMTRDHLTIVTNGEVYNFADIRKLLEQEGITFTSQTDTEVILRAYQKWGSGALHKFNGMFALAIWDDRKKTLFLARDRIGIKPLFYYKDSRILLFGSEVQALLRSGCIPIKINWKFVYQQILINSYYHHDHDRTPIKGIYSIPPGHFMLVKPDGQVQTERYWELPGTQITGDPSQEELARQLQELLEDSMRLRLVSDVPVAAFLSGGMDSSVICALASKLVKGYKLTAITVSYEGEGKDIYSESPDQDLEYSRIAAKALKGNIYHKIVNMKPADISLDSLDAIIEPGSITDDERLLTVSKNYQVVKKHGFKVVLNGQGADELMGGYVSLSFFIKTMMDVQHPDKFLIKDSFPLMSIPGKHALNEAVLKYVDGIYENLYNRIQGYPGDLLEKIHRFFMNTGLQRILRLEDFLSMSSSVECRVPFLDHRIVEWAFKIPFYKHIQVEDRTGKILLRRAASSYLPQRILDRPKQTFPGPNQQRIEKTLLNLYQENRSDITRTEIIRRLYKKNFLEQENPRSSSRQLLLLIILWRWQKKLTEVCSNGF